MDRNETIQLFLFEVGKKSSLDLNSYVQLQLKDLYKNLKEFNLIVDIMLTEGLIEHVGSTDRYFKITPFGQSIQDSGGWLRYLKNKEDNARNEDESKYLENQKLKAETKILKWQIKTFWPLFILAIIGGLCGIISLILQLFT